MYISPQSKTIYISCMCRLACTLFFCGLMIIIWLDHYYAKGKQMH